MKKRRLAALALVTAMTASLVGCSGGQKSEPVPGKEAAVEKTETSAPAKTEEAATSEATEWNWPALNEMKVGFCEADLSSTYRTAESNDQEAVAKARGYEMITVNSEGDTERQISDIESLLAQGCNVIIVVPIDADAIQPALDLCRDKKVPVIIKNRGCNGVPGVDYVTHIASDFVYEGELCAEWVYEKCTEKGLDTIKVAEIQGVIGGTDVRDRSGGFHSVADKYGNFEFVAQQSANWSRSEAQEVASNILQSTGGDVDVFYCHNDEMALGVYTAIEIAGLKVNEDVFLIGIDGMYEALDAIKEGKMSCTVTCTPKTGELNFDVIERAIGGEKLDTYIRVDDVLLDIDNVEENYEKLGF